MGVCQFSNVVKKSKDAVGGCLLWEIEIPISQFKTFYLVHMFVYDRSSVIITDIFFYFICLSFFNLYLFWQIKASLYFGFLTGPFTLSATHHHVLQTLLHSPILYLLTLQLRPFTYIFLYLFNLRNAYMHTMLDARRWDIVNYWCLDSRVYICSVVLHKLHFNFIKSEIF